MRIVSVLPSASEIVCALGARAELVGRSAECDYPADVLELPVVMRPRTLDADRPSAEIDQRVRSARSAGESLYELDVPLLRRLRPDVLLTQDLCGVCSVTGEEVARACAEADVHPEIVALTPRTLDEVWASVETVGAAIGRADLGRRRAAELRQRARPSGSPPRSSVAVVEWLDPPILAGLWTPSMIVAAGGVALGPSGGDVGHRTTWEAIAELRPELLVLSPCSFPVDRTLAELRRSALTGAVVRSVVDGRAYVADEAYFSRPGPRLAHGVELLRGLLADAEGPFPMPVRSLEPDAGVLA